MTEKNWSNVETPIATDNTEGHAPQPAPKVQPISLYARFTATLRGKPFSHKSYAAWLERVTEACLRDLRAERQLRLAAEDKVKEIEKGKEGENV